MAERTNQEIQGSSSSCHNNQETIVQKHGTLLCCEVTNSSFNLPEVLEVLYSKGTVENSCDALAVVLHVLMIEAGFCPKDITEGLQYTMMPNGWKGQGVYRIVYSHPTCPDVNFRMTAFPMNSFLVVYGTVDGNDATTTQLQLKVSTYINFSHDFLCASEVFLHLPNLSQTFKDNIAHCLLASAQNMSGVCPTFGLSAMMTELKMQILSYLTAKQLVAMSAVNKEFHELSKLPSLWRRLFLQDFPHVKEQTVGVTDWKKLYKDEYLNQQQYHQLRLHHQARFVIPGFHRYPPPPHAHFGWPSRIIGGDIDREPDFRIGITPEVESAFPNLTQRLQGPALPLPSINPPAVPRIFNHPF